MIEINQITTIDQLYRSNGALTGNVMVDAVVEQLKTTNIHDGADIALVLRVDHRFLSKAMEVFVGLSLRELIIQWRVRQIVDLLDDPNLSLEEIASRTGYQATKSLSSVMMRYFGTTPTIYRDGTININGQYPMNLNPTLLKKAQENAQSLHNRDWKNK